MTGLMNAVAWFRSYSGLTQGLLFMAGVIFALTLHLLGVAGLTSLQATTVLFAIAFVSRISRHPVTPQSQPSLLNFIAAGLWMLGLGLFQAPLAAQSWLIYLVPLFTAIGLSLLVFGRSQWSKYQSDLSLFLILILPIERLIHPLNNFLGVSHFMARLSTFFLWYIGFTVDYHGDFIVFPGRATWIDPHCAGIATILWMLQLSLLFLILIPVSNLYRFMVPTMAILVVLFVNGIRLGMLAFFAATSPKLFDFWHSDNSQIFSTLPIVLFSLFCGWVYQNRRALRVE